jgi:phosphatidylserine decarboxylase
LIRSAAFLRAYRLLPQRLLNRGFSRLTALTRPRFAVDAAIRGWARAERIDLRDFEDRRYASIDDFFLRRLRPGARPLGRGLVSPVDGRVLASGRLSAQSQLLVKGQRLSLDRVVNSRLHAIELGPYDGGSFAVVFLSPRGYHRVHAPAGGELLDVHWIPGRWFPQNEAALEHIPRIYERNERAVLRCALRDGRQYLLVMVGASLVGGIHLQALPRSAWVRRDPAAIGQRHAKGDELGHFAFGSTVVALLPAGMSADAPALGEVRMGETLFELSSEPSQRAWRARCASDQASKCRR